MTLSEGSGTRRGDAAREAPPARTSEAVLQLAKMPRAWGLQQHGASTTPSGAPAARCKTASSQKEQGGGNPPWGPSWQTLGPPPQRFHLTTFPPCPTRLCPQRCLGQGAQPKRPHAHLPITRQRHGHTVTVLIAGSGPPSRVLIVGPHRGSPSLCTALCCRQPRASTLQESARAGTIKRSI